MDQITSSATLGQSMVRWAAGTTLGMFLGVAGVVLVITGHPIDAAAIGAFAAGWGGPAFGAMFGAGAYAIRQEDLAIERGEVGANHAPIG